MNKNSDSDFQIAKMISVSQMIMACVIVGLTELMIRGSIGTGGVQALSEDSFSLLRITFIALAALMLILAYFLKKTLRTLREGAFLNILKYLAMRIRQTGSSSVMGLLIPPFALCEMVVILGFVLFILSPGYRNTCYPFYLAGLAMMLYIFPNQDEKENIIRLDDSYKS